MLIPGCPSIFSKQLPELCSDGSATDDSYRSKEELSRFPSDTYLPARKLILDKWAEAPTQYLSLEACLAESEADQADLLKSVYLFLLAHGCINIGAVHPPEAPPAPDVAAEAEEAKPIEDPAPAALSKKKLVLRLYEILRTIDFAVATEKTIRKQLEKEFDCSLQDADSKALVKKHVMHVLENMETRETLEPLDLPEEEEKKEEAELTKKEVAAPQPPRRVVVIGAGAAGLAAASTLKKCGTEVIVLEASDTIGGRFGASSAPKPASGEDPMETDGSETVINLGPELWLPGCSKPACQDPIQTMARQLGLTLTDTCTDRVVKMFDPKDGSLVSEEVLIAAEKLRDELLAEVKSSEASSSSSLGEALHAALLKRKVKAVPPAAADKESAEEGKTHVEMVKSEENGKIKVNKVKAEEEGEAKPDGTTPAEVKGEDGEDGVKSEEEGPAGVKGECEGGVKSEATAHADVTADSPAADDADAGVEAQSTIHTESQEADAFPNLELLAVEWLLKLLEHESGAALGQLPVSFLSREFCDPSNWRVQLSAGGSKGLEASRQLLLALSLGLDIRLGDPVREVLYSKQGVFITTKSGTKLEAAAAVIAVPLSTLNSGNISFDPPLPMWKSSAMGRLSVGTRARALLYYPTAFWEGSSAGVLSAGSALALLPASETAADDAPAPLMLQLVSQSPAILAAEYSGLDALKACQMSKPVLQAAVTGMLGKMFPALSPLPEPSACVVSQWGDGVSAGGPTYLGQGATDDDVAATAMPLKHTLCFAGDHTVVGSCPSGALHSALNSGLREAARCWRILSLLDASASGADVEGGLEIGDELPSSDQLTRFKERAKACEKDAKEAEKRAKKQAGKQKKVKKDDDADQEMEDSEDEDDEDGDEEGRDAPKRKRKAKESHKAAKKSVGEKKRRKRSSGDDDEEDEEDEEGRSRGSKAKKLRKPEIRDPNDGAPGSLGAYDPQKAERELRRREEARHDKKAAHKTMIQAQSGNLTPLWELMTQCADNLDMQQHMVHVIEQASVDVLDIIAVDNPILKILAGWLGEFATNGSAEHLVSGVFRLLKRLPCSLGVLKTSGMAMAAKKVSQDHRNKDIRKAAEELMQAWVLKAKGASAAPPAKKTSAPAVRPPAGGARPASGSASGPKPPVLALGSSAPPVRAPLPPLPMTAHDLQIAEQIRAAEAQLAIAEQESLLAAKQAQAQAMQTAAHVALPKISTFDEFHKSSKSSSSKVSGSGHRSGGHAKTAPAKSYGLKDPLTHYVQTALQYHVKKSTITNEQSVKIKDKLIIKVNQHEEGEGRKVDANYMSDDNNKKRVKKLLESYVASYAKSKSK